MPIVYSSEKFTQTTGYNRADALFKPTSLQFMAGPKTSRQSLQSIETGMENCETFQVDIILYKKTGTARLFQVQAVPITNDEGRSSKPFVFETQTPFDLCQPAVAHLSERF